MCDYSLTHLATRNAEVGDKLVSTLFPNTITRGFASEDAPNVPVCLRPGTELAFDEDIVHYEQAMVLRRKTENVRVGRFCQVDVETHHTHHDALELPDGVIIKLADLLPGQRVTVLQMPADTVRTPVTEGLVSLTNESLSQHTHTFVQEEELLVP